MRVILIYFATVLLIGCNSKRETKSNPEGNEVYKGPIIDMHVHSSFEEEFTNGAICLPIINTIQHFDPRDNYLELWNEKFQNPECEDPIWAPKSYEEFVRRIRQQFEQYNIVGAVTSGPLQM
ncbi:hypothetical protein [Robiginitalea sp. SC105]|uniref:hypothetical protein n=1 Tax=Robiginitalea sp. SC105 TaxID=2762332 RepID=UPI00163A3766|nr:hypothetical protein [Robiginitalea sp. SC105]MBC2839727.1 hypothetical protein [Robiginitalea sp. SC105]